MRCFISVDAAESLRGKIGEMQHEISKLGLGVKLVEPENLHFTVNFMGEVNEDEVKRVIKSLDFLRSEPAFKIEISGLHHFGPSHRPRTLWLGVNEGMNEMEGLMKAVNENVKAGEMNFSPHLTIARVKSSKNVNVLKDFMMSHSNVKIGEMMVKYVKLKGSELASRGPLYKDVSVFELKG